MNTKKIIIYSILFLIISGCSNNIFADNLTKDQIPIKTNKNIKKKKVYIIKRIYVLAKDGKIIENREITKKNEDKKEEKDKVLFENEESAMKNENTQEEKLSKIKKETNALLPEDNKNFYFDIFTGFTSLNYKLLGYNTLNTQPIYTDELASKQTNNAFGGSFNLTFGARVYKNYLRTELEGGIIYNFYNKATSNSGNNFGKADAQSFFISWNWIADLPISSRFSLSLGAGIGAYFFSLKDLESIGAPGLKTIVALNYRLSENTFVYIKYSPSFILFNDTVSSSKIIQANTTGNVLGSYAKSNGVFIMNTIGIGIRYFFW